MSIDEHFSCCLCADPAEFRADIGCLCEACQMEQMKLAAELLLRFGLRPMTPWEKNAHAFRHLIPSNRR